MILNNIMWIITIQLVFQGGKFCEFHKSFAISENFTLKIFTKGINKYSAVCEAQVYLWLNTTESRGTCMFSTMYGKTAQLQSNCTINTRLSSQQCKPSWKGERQKEVLTTKFSIKEKSQIVKRAPEYRIRSKITIVYYCSTELLGAKCF